MPNPSDLLKLARYTYKIGEIPGLTEKLAQASARIAESRPVKGIREALRELPFFSKKSAYMPTIEASSRPGASAFDVVKEAYQKGIWARHPENVAQSGMSRDILAALKRIPASQVYIATPSREPAAPRLREALHEVTTGTQARLISKSYIQTPGSKVSDEVLLIYNPPERAAKKLVIKRPVKAEAPKERPGAHRAPETEVERKTMQRLYEEEERARAAGRPAVPTGEQPKPAGETVDTPPLRPGFVRLYRGEAAPGKGKVPEWIQQHKEALGITEAEGRWFTDDPKIAEWYVKEAGETGRLMYADVPRKVAEESRVSNLPAARYSRNLEREYFLPKGVLKRPLEIPAAAPAPTPPAPAPTTPAALPEAKKPLGAFSSVKKIISGGQSGGDLGGNLFAEDVGIPHEINVFRGTREGRPSSFRPQTEGGRKLFDRFAKGGKVQYPKGLDDLDISTREQYIGGLRRRTKYNVEQGAATILFTDVDMAMTRGTKFTHRLAREAKRPSLIVDLRKPDDENAKLIADWVSKVRPSVLNIAGRRELNEQRVAEVLHKAAAVDVKPRVAAAGPPAKADVFGQFDRAIGFLRDKQEEYRLRGMTRQPRVSLPAPGGESKTVQQMVREESMVVGERIPKGVRAPEEEAAVRKALGRAVDLGEGPITTVVRSAELARSAERRPSQIAAPFGHYIYVYFPEGSPEMRAELLRGLSQAAPRVKWAGGDAVSEAPGAIRGFIPETIGVLRFKVQVPAKFRIAEGDISDEAAVKLLGENLQTRSLYTDIKSLGDISNAEAVNEAVYLTNLLKNTNPEKGISPLDSAIEELGAELTGKVKPGIYRSRDKLFEEIKYPVLVRVMELVPEASRLGPSREPTRRLLQNEAERHAFVGQRLVPRLLERLGLDIEGGGNGPFTLRRLSLPERVQSTINRRLGDAMAVSPASPSDEAIGRAIAEVDQILKSARPGEPGRLSPVVTIEVNPDAPMRGIRRLRTVISLQLAKQLEHRVSVLPESPLKAPITVLVPYYHGDSGLMGAWARLSSLPASAYKRRSLRGWATEISKTLHGEMVYAPDEKQIAELLKSRPNVIVIRDLDERLASKLFPHAQPTRSAQWAVKEIEKQLPALTAAVQRRMPAGIGRNTAERAKYAEAFIEDVLNALRTGKETYYPSGVTAWYKQKILDSVVEPRRGQRGMSVAMEARERGLEPREVLHGIWLSSDLPKPAGALASYFDPERAWYMGPGREVAERGTAGKITRQIEGETSVEEMLRGQPVTAEEAAARMGERQTTGPQVPEFQFGAEPKYLPLGTRPSARIPLREREELVRQVVRSIVPEGADARQREEVVRSLLYGEADDVAAVLDAHPLNIISPVKANEADKAQLEKIARDIVERHWAELEGRVNEAIARAEQTGEFNAPTIEGIGRIMDTLEEFSGRAKDMGLAKQVDQLYEQLAAKQAKLLEAGTRDVIDRVAPRVEKAMGEVEKMLDSIDEFYLDERGIMFLSPRMAEESSILRPMVTKDPEVGTIQGAFKRLRDYVTIPFTLPEPWMRQNPITRWFWEKLIMNKQAGERRLSADMFEDAKRIINPFSQADQKLIWEAREGRIPLAQLTPEMQQAERQLSIWTDAAARKNGILADIGDEITVDDVPWKVMSMTRPRPGVAEGTVTLESRTGQTMVLDFSVVNPGYRGNYVPHAISGHYLLVNEGLLDINGANFAPHVSYVPFNTVDDLLRWLLDEAHNVWPGFSATPLRQLIRQDPAAVERLLLDNQIRFRPKIAPHTEIIDELPEGLFRKMVLDLTGAAKEELRSHGLPEDVIGPASIHNALKQYLLPGPKPVYNAFLQGRTLNLEFYEDDLEKALHLYSKATARKHFGDQLRKTSTRVIEELRQWVNTDTGEDFVSTLVPGVRMKGAKGNRSARTFLRNINDFVAEIEGVRPSTAEQMFDNIVYYAGREYSYAQRRMLRNITALTAINRLGSPFSALGNLSQIVVDAFPVLGKYTFVGAKEAWLAATRPTEVITVAGQQMTRKQLMKRLGVDLVVPKHMFTQRPYTPAREKLEHWVPTIALYMFNGAEKVNHSVTGFGAFYKGLSQGMSVDAAIEKAIVRGRGRTQFWYTQEALPAIMRKSPFWKTALQFKPYLFNQLNFMLDIFSLKRLPQELRYDSRRAEVTRFLIATAAVSGLMGIPLISLLDRTLYRATLDPATGEGFSFLDEIRQMKPELFSRASLRGLLAIGDMDISGRTSIGTDIEIAGRALTQPDVGVGDVISSISPFAGLASDAMSAGMQFAFKRRTEDSADRVWKAILPLQLWYPYYAWKGYTGLTPKRLGVIPVPIPEKSGYVDPSDIRSVDRQGTKITSLPREGLPALIWLAKAMGGRSVHESEVSEANTRLRIMTEKWRTERDKYRDLAVQAKKQGKNDLAREYMRKARLAGLRLEMGDYSEAEEQMGRGLLARTARTSPLPFRELVREQVEELEPEEDLPSGGTSGGFRRRRGGFRRGF